MAVEHRDQQARGDHHRVRQRMAAEPGRDRVADHEGDQRRGQPEQRGLREVDPDAVEVRAGGHAPAAPQPRDGAEGVDRDDEREQRRDRQRGEDRQPVGGDQPGLLHHADRGGHEEQREVLQEPSTTPSSAGAGAAGGEDAGEQQPHAEHRAGKGEAERRHNDLAGELAEKQQGQGVDHAASASGDAGVCGAAAVRARGGRRLCR